MTAHFLPFDNAILHAFGTAWDADKRNAIAAIVKLRTQLNRMGAMARERLFDLRRLIQSLEPTSRRRTS